jgi:chemotaxis protein methyltransferase CheR
VDAQVTMSATVELEPLLPPIDDAGMRELLEVVFQRYQHDFRHYAQASLRRRTQVAIAQLGLESLAELSARVAHDAQVFARLLQYLTVPTTEMFRDPGYWKSFRDEICPVLATYPSLKLWVAGCSTGEEPYSLAIVLAEEGLLSRSLVYATDVNPESLARAQQGVFRLDRLMSYTENHRASGAPGSLADHYVAKYDHAIFDRALRERIVFSDHSLATDGVFAEVQLVSCRNLLIYFDRILQDRALGLFRDALVRRGFLGLGPQESVRFSAHHEAFIELPATRRWYRRV